MPQDEGKVVIDSAPTEQSLARLLKLSGERSAPTPDASARAHAAALEAWQSTLVAGRSQRRRKLVWSLAAAVAAVTIGAIVWSSFSSSLSLTRIAASSVLVTGSVDLVGANGEVRALSAGDGVCVQSQLITREGAAALQVGDSLSLRVNRYTRLRFDAANRITLLAGMVYIDSGGLSARSDLRIATPAGEVRHEGTQYLVSVNASETHIQVREGRVRLKSDNADETAHISSGEALDVDRAGHVSRHTVPTFGSEWEWTSALATSLDIENRPLVEFLAWMAREHGWQLRYATPDVERLAQTIRLHGAAQSGTPEQALRRVGLITGLALHVEQGVLVIDTAEASVR